MVVASLTGWRAFNIVWPAFILAFLILQRVTAKRREVELDIHVGNIEPHTVRFAWNANRAITSIAADGVRIPVEVVRLPKWGPTTQWEYKVQVGEAENHTVTFVRTKKYVLGLRRKQTVVAYLDGVGYSPAEGSQHPASSAL